MATRTRSLIGRDTPSRGLNPRGRRGPLAPVDAFRGSLATGLRRQLSTQAARMSLADVDGWLLAVVVALSAGGLVMVYSASEALAYTTYGNASWFFEHQAAYVTLGLVLALVVMRIDYHRWRSMAPLLAVGAVGLLILVLIPHLGQEKLGARRWLTLGPLSLQPSALATLVAVVYMSRWLAGRGPSIRMFRAVRDFSVLLGILLALVVAERDLGSAIVLAAVGLGLLALAGARRRGILLVALLLLGCAYLAVRMESYRSSRLTSFRDPFSDPLNTGFQSVQSLYALGSGGIHGVGLGNSVQKYLWLPEAHTDFIFAIIGEELGLIGTLAVIAGFMFLAWRGMRAAMRAPDAFGTLMAGGMTVWISVQAFVNMAAVTGVVPITGITLPFVSYGGTSIVATLIATGVLCNISAQGRRHGEARRAHVDRRGWNGRTSDTRHGGGEPAATPAG